MAAIFAIVLATSLGAWGFISKKKRIAASAPETVQNSIEERSMAEVRRETAEVLDRIAGLQKKKQGAERARVELEGFKVGEARFFKKGENGSLSAMIELSLRNATSVQVSRAYFTGTLSSRGGLCLGRRAFFARASPAG